MKHIDWQNIAYALIFFIFTLFIIPSLCFIVGFSMLPWFSIISFFISLSFLFFSNNNRITIVYSILVFCVLVVGSLLLVALLYDYSYDGPWYHQIAMIYLKNGWNPIYEKMSDVSELRDFLIAEIWIENYNKAFEIIGANLYAITNKLECGKAQNLILLIAVFIYGIYTLKLYTSSWFKAIVFSFLLSCSPVVMSQIWTNYLDGFLSLLFLMALFAILKIERNDNKLDYFVLGIAFILLAGSKLTGIVYAGIIGISYFIFCCFYKKCIKKILILGVISLMCITITNINPWMTNLIKGEHIFYPLFGEKKVDIITPHTTKNFAQKNRVEQFFISIFSRTQNKDFANREPLLKFPFTIDKDEEYLSVPDTRIGGFGFLFSGIIVFSFFACLLSINIVKKNDLRLFLLIMVIVVATTFINPAPWWARYVPQVWFLPLFALFFLVKRRFFVVVGIILSLVNVVEAFTFSSASALIHALELMAIANNVDDKKVTIKPLDGVIKSYIFKFQEKEVEIIENKDALCNLSEFHMELLEKKCDVQKKVSVFKKLRLLLKCI